MLSIALGCLAASIIFFAICTILAKSKTWSFIFQICSLIALVAMCLVVFAFETGFNGFTICTLSAIIPQLFSLFYPEGQAAREKVLAGKMEVKNDKSNSSEEKQEEISQSTTQNNVEIEKTEKNNKNLKPAKQKIYDYGWTHILTGLTSLASVSCLAIASFYYGFENFYGFAIGGLLGLAILFAMLAVKKPYSPLKYIGKGLSMIAAGVALAQIILVLTYSISLKSLIVAEGLLVFACFAGLKGINNKKGINLLFYLSILSFLAVLLIDVLKI